MGRRPAVLLAAPASVALALLLAVSVPVAGAGDVTSANDAEGDISLPDVDIVKVEAGVLPAGNRRIPPGTEGLAVWVKFTFAGQWPPAADLFSWFASDSKFFPDPDEPGQTIHLSGVTQRHDGASRTFPVCADDSSSCPPQRFPVQAIVTPGALFLIQGIPYRPTQLSVRAAAGVQPNPTASREIDAVPDNEAARIRVNLDPVDPFASSGRTTTDDDSTGADTDTAARDGSDPRDTGSDDGGFPILIVIIVLVVVGIGLVVFFAARRAGPVSGTYPDWDATYPDWQPPSPDDRHA